MIHNTIQDIIPQKEPFVFVDKLLSVSETQFVSTFTPLHSQILVIDGCLSEAGMMENIAQTAAAGIGVYLKSQNQTIPRGFIGAVKNLKIKKLSPVNQTLTTTIQILQEVLGVTLIAASIQLGEELIASCEMKIVLERL